MVQLYLLLILKSAEAFTPTYSTYNQVYMPTTISTSRDGSVYSCITTNAIEYYRKINNQYTFVTRAYLVCSNSTSCVGTKQTMSYDGSRILAYSGNENYILRVYKIVNDRIVFSQAIQRNLNSVIYYQVAEDFLLIPSSTSFDFYKYNSNSGLYQAIVLNQVFPSAVLYYGFSTDGRFMLGITSTLTAHIYTYQGTALSFLTSSTLPPTTNYSTFTEFKIEKMNSSSYTIILALSVTNNGLSSQRRLHYYSMSLTGVVTFQSQIDSIFYYYGAGNLYFSKNTKYILWGIQPSTIKLYQFNPANNTYILTHNLTNFWAGSPTNNYIAEDATFIYGSKSTSSEATLYYACTVPNCLTCATLSQCWLCAATFTLTANKTCACNASQALVNSSCLSCNLAHCSHCSSADVCSVCVSGFTLVNNSCVCADKNTISSVDGTCVSCNVIACYRCDQADVCSLFASSQQAQQAGVSGSQIAALVLLVTILLFMGGLLIYLLVKVRSLTNKQEKVHPSQSRDAFQPSQIKSKAYLNQSQGHSRDPSFQTINKTNNSSQLPQQTPLWSKWRLQPVQVQAENVVSRSQHFNQRLDRSHVRTDKPKALKKERRISSIDDNPQQQVISVEVIKGDR